MTSGDPVFLAWYHDGFVDDAPFLLGVYTMAERAYAALEEHKRTGDRSCEFKNYATWTLTTARLDQAIGQTT